MGLLAFSTFFAWGYILERLWNALGTGVSIHAYAWISILVCICRVANIVPERIEVSCCQWSQFVMKNLANMLLPGFSVLKKDVPDLGNEDISKAVQQEKKT